jgi:hypothetical protein
MSRFFFISILLIFMLVFFTGCESSGNNNENDSVEFVTTVDFMNQLQSYCGNTYSGKTIYPNESGHQLTNARLKITFETCDDNQIRIPFHINDDTSRMWIFTLTDKGKLTLKHDHNHRDTSIYRELTMYGGEVKEEGTAYSQQFFADDDTVFMMPDASGNIWSFDIDPVSGILTYKLTRNQVIRFHGEFNLSSPASN